MRMTMKGFFLAMLILLTSAGVSVALDDATLEDLTSISTRTEKPVTDAPGSVSIITKKEIEKRNVKTLDGTLTLTPGAFLRRGRGLSDGQSGIWLRGVPGSGPSRTLVLLNGIPMNDSSTGRVSFGAEVAPEDLEKVEVVKGPFSSLYGTNAVGGVVNIITRMPAGREFTLKSGYGSGWKRGTAEDDYRKYYLSYGDRVKDKLSLLLSYRYQGTNGYPTSFNGQTANPAASVATPGITGAISTTTTAGAARYLIGDQGDHTWWDDSLTLQAGYDLTGTSNVRLLVNRARSENQDDDPHTYLRDASGNPVWTYVVGATTVRDNSYVASYGANNQNMYAANYENQIGVAQLKFAVGFLEQPDNWFVTPGTTAVTTRTGGLGRLSTTPNSQYTGDLQIAFPVMRRQLLVIGGSIKSGEIKVTDTNLSDWKDRDSKTTYAGTAEGKDRTYAVFLQDEILLHNSLTAYVGVRQDWWHSSDGSANQVGVAGFPQEYPSKSEGALSPKAALVYKPFARTTLKTSWGKAFRSPSLNDLYRTTVTVGVTSTSNPSLKPETTTAWEIGVEQGFLNRGIFKVTYFENHFKDLIYRKQVSPTLRENVNAGKAKGSGVEVEIDYKPSSSVRLFTNYTHNDTKMQENDAAPTSVGKKLTYVPDQMFNIGGELGIGRVTTSLTGSYVGKMFSTDDNSDTSKNVFGSYDPWFLLNAKAACQLTKAVSLSLAVDNILDRDYYIFYKAPGTSWFTELTMKF